jgi:hypothetical protein
MEPALAGPPPTFDHTTAEGRVQFLNHQIKIISEAIVVEEMQSDPDKATISLLRTKRRQLWTRHTIALERYWCEMTGEEPLIDLSLQSEAADDQDREDNQGDML